MHGCGSLVVEYWTWLDLTQMFSGLCMLTQGVLLGHYCLSTSCQMLCICWHIGCQNMTVCLTLLKPSC